MNGNNEFDTKVKRAFSDPEAEKVPQSLRPENIGKLLDKREPKVVKFPLRQFVSIAAAVVIVICAAVLLPGLKDSQISGTTFGQGESSVQTASSRQISPDDSGDGYADVTALFARLAQKAQFNRYDKGMDMLAENAPGAVESSMTASAVTSPDSETNGDDYSSTNVQVENVDEADTLKTDGKYIYYISGDYVQPTVRIASAENGVLTELWSYRGDGRSASQLFLYGDKLVVLMNDYGFYQLDGYKESYSQTMRVEIFDVSDRSAPVMIRSFEQEGAYNTARLTDGKLLLISTEYQYYYNYSIDGKLPEDFDVQSVIPKICDSVAGDEFTVLPSDRCYVFPDADSSAFTVITRLDLDDDGSKADSLTIVGGEGAVYANTENIYVTSPSYEYEATAYTYNEIIYANNWGRFIGNYTDVTRISMSGDRLEVIATAKLHGSLCSQFAMDEYEGNLRVATNYSFYEGENYKQTNNFYVLDGGMNLIGSLEGLAEGENMYSVRFSGQTVYAVTYRTVDPFFVINLSDPTHPYVEGELKIPGFSQYLHSYSGNLVIGFGMDSVESADGSVALTRGFKVAMFDVSDPENPKELNTLYIGDRGSYSALSYDHKALLYDKEKNIIAFPISIAKLPEGSASIYDYGTTVFNGYIVLGYDETNGFYERGRIEHSQSYKFSSEITRACYIGNTIFTLSDAELRATDLASFTEISAIEFGNEYQYEDTQEQSWASTASTSSKLY